MVEFRNKITGGVMWVAEDRVDEYKAAGHVPAAHYMNEPVDAGMPTEDAKPATKRKPRVKK